MTATIELTVSDYSELRTMRGQLAHLLHGNGVTQPVATDVQVVASELATNGLMHTASNSVSVEATVFDDGIELVVRHGDDARSADPITRLDQGGRGLRIVDAIADGRCVQREAETRSTEVRFALTGAPS